MIGIKTEKDMPIPVRDGLKLAANIYRPDKSGRYPVIMAFTGFGEDGFWAERHFGWQVAYEPGSPTVTGAITFEVNDPAFKESTAAYDSSEGNAEFAIRFNEDIELTDTSV